MKKPRRVSAVVVAAGSSLRMGGIDKLTCLLGGIPAAVRSVLAFESLPEIQEIVLVTAPERVDEFAKLLKPFGAAKLKTVVPGGATRQQSVLAGVLACGEGTEYLCIHDAARPLVTREAICAALSAAFEYGAAAAAVPVKDTIKISRTGFVEGTPDRSTLFAVQTPQVFQRELYLSAAKDAEREYSDDCQLVEAAGGQVFLSKGDYRNIKLTTPDDLAAARAFLEMEASKCSESDTDMMFTG